MDGYDERRGRGTVCGYFGGENEVFAVIGDDHAEEEDGEDVEEEDAEESELNGTGNGFAWVLSFANGDANEFSTCEIVSRDRKGC